MFFSSLFVLILIKCCVTDKTDDKHVQQVNDLVKYAKDHLSAEEILYTDLHKWTPLAVLLIVEPDHSSLFVVRNQCDNDNEARRCIDLEKTVHAQLHARCQRAVYCDQLLMNAAEHKMLSASCFQILQLFFTLLITHSFTITVRKICADVHRWIFVLLKTNCKYLFLIN